MIAGKARTPREAERIMKYYGVTRAADALRLMPQDEKPYWWRWWRRFVHLVMRIEGASFHHRQSGYDDWSRLPDDPIVWDET